jgi:hypothetical protein
MRRPNSSNSGRFPRSSSLVFARFFSFLLSFLSLRSRLLEEASARHQHGWQKPQGGLAGSNHTGSRKQQVAAASAGMHRRTYSGSHFGSGSDRESESADPACPSSCRGRGHGFLHPDPVRGCRCAEHNEALRRGATHGSCPCDHALASPCSRHARNRRGSRSPCPESHRSGLLAPPRAETPPTRRVDIRGNIDTASGEHSSRAHILLVPLPLSLSSHAGVSQRRLLWVATGWGRARREGAA